MHSIHSYTRLNSIYLSFSKEFHLISDTLYTENPTQIHIVWANAQFSSSAVDAIQVKHKVKDTIGIFKIGVLMHASRKPYLCSNHRVNPLSDKAQISPQDLKIISHFLTLLCNNFQGFLGVSSNKFSQPSGTPCGNTHISVDSNILGYQGQECKLIVKNQVKCTRYKTHIGLCVCEDLFQNITSHSLFISGEQFPF